MHGRDFSVPGRSPALAENAMVATSHPLVTLAAVEILRAGGNAMDAAIAAAALQGVVDPHMTGIGGDCFVLFAPAVGPMTAYNGSGRAAKAATVENHSAEGRTAIPDDSALAVTVPGAVDTWCRAHADFGRLDFDRLLQPAIEAAENGYVVLPRVAADWSRYGHRLQRHPDAARQFLKAGEAPAVGDRRDHPALAATLRSIARHGRDAFYHGPVAAEIVATLRGLGGLLDEEDLAGFASERTKDISAPYRDHVLHECPPNGQGIAALLIARLLDGFDLTDPRLTDADRIHLFAETTKAAYRQRDVLVGELGMMTVTVEDVLSDRNVDAIRGRIRMDVASQAQDWDYPMHRDTVYISVVDRDRNAVSLINSLFYAFGSGIYAKQSGVLLQNRGAGFSLRAGHPNAIGSSKRPMHTIIPAIVSHKGRPVASFGVMGGQYQATGHAQFLSGVLDCGLDVQAASERPRSFYTEGAITLETTISEETRVALEERGHLTRRADEPLGGCQAIWIDHDRGILWGSSDHRKDGIALGY